MQIRYIDQFYSHRLDRSKIYIMSEKQNEDREVSGVSEAEMEMGYTDSSSEDRPILPPKKKKRRFGK